MEVNDWLIALWTARYQRLMECAEALSDNDRLKSNLKNLADAYRQCADELCEPPEELFKVLNLE